jgi:hypothetical protein
MNHKNLVELEEQGKIIIGVDRVMARKFFINVSIKKTEEETGETPYFEKIIVWLAFLFGPISLLASIILGFWFLNWWGVICFIFCPFIYFVYTSSSAKGNSRITEISLLLLISACIYFFKIFNAPQITGFTTIFVFSLWCVRFLYCSSTFLLRNFVIRNEKAYQYLVQYLKIRSIE